jgi:Family of unknown function (DUF6677)
VTAETFPRKPVPIALGLCAINWLLPGVGFILCKDYRRGALLFVLINLVFFLGVFFGGYVDAPGSWKPFTPNFNLVTGLTYIAQSFYGGGWLCMEYLQGLGEDGGGPFNIINLATKTYADLGVFHLVVAGGLNYFCTVRLYDFLAGIPEETIGEGGGVSDDPESENASISEKEG